MRREDVCINRKIVNALKDSRTPRKKKSALRMSRKVNPDPPTRMATLVEIDATCVTQRASAATPVMRRNRRSLSSLLRKGSAAKSRKITPPRVRASSDNVPARKRTESRSKSLSSQIKVNYRTTNGISPRVMCPSLASACQRIV